VNGIPQNVSNFLLHAAAIPTRTALEPRLDGSFEVTNYELGHTRDDITISSPLFGSDAGI
jgi:hypothetical protein